MSIIIFLKNHQNLYCFKMLQLKKWQFLSWNPSKMTIFGEKTDDFGEKWIIFGRVNQIIIVQNFFDSYGNGYFRIG